jgi:alkyl hydroperoxide reductase subunit AhpC
VQLQQCESELERRNVKVVIVTFEAGFLARAYLEDTGLGWPLLIDSTREVYKAYDMLEAAFWDIWGPHTWWAYLREITRGHLPKRSEGDITQRGGDVLINPEGIVRLHHVGQGPGDRPSARSILQAIDTKSDVAERQVMRGIK